MMNRAILRRGKHLVVKEKVLDLTILIPSFNRAAWVRRQLLFFRKCVLNGVLSQNFEILISDNHSDPSIDSFIGDLKIFGQTGMPIRIIKPPRHYPTAEESLLFGLEHCKSNYIWALGDDDPPNEEGFLLLLEEVRRNKFDLVLFDSNKIRLSGVIQHGSAPCSRPEEIQSLLDFVKRSGFMFSLAGFSNSLLRRPSAKELSIFREIINSEKIYSHVFWMVEIFWNRKFKYIPTPLVFYTDGIRDNADAKIETWPALCIQHDVYRLYFWTFGFCQQIKRLRRMVNLPIGWLRSAYTFHWGIDRLPTLDQIAKLLLEEVEREPPINRLPRAMRFEELTEVLEFLVEENSEYLPFVNALEAVYLKEDNHETSLAFALNYRNQISKFALSHYYYSSYQNWKIYKSSVDGYIAIHLSCNDEYVRTCLNDLTPITGPGFIVSPCIGKTLKTIRQLG